MSNTLRMLAVALMLFGAGVLVGRRLPHASPQTPVSGAPAAKPAGRRLLYWANPMDPKKHSDHFKKDSMNMAYVPVYASAARAPEPGVPIDPRMVQALGVRLVTVERRSMGHEIRTVGTITVDDNRRFDVNLRVSGWITALPVRAVGDTVRKGQVLARVYAPKLYAAETEYLLARQSPATMGRELEAAAQERLHLLGLSRADVAALAKTGRAHKVLTLRAPQAGTVLELGVRTGSYVTPGTRLFEIANLDRVWAKVALYTYQLPWVRTGDAVTLQPAHDPRLQQTGRIQFLYPTLNPQSRTVQARIVLHNPGGGLRPGMYVNATVTGRPVQALAVPADAVLRSSDGNYVMVAAGQGHFVPTEVALGPETGGWVAIRRGLKRGQQVATSAQFLLYSESQMQQVKARMLGPTASSTAAGARP